MCVCVVYVQLPVQPGKWTCRSFFHEDLVSMLGCGSVLKQLTPKNGNGCFWPPFKPIPKKVPTRIP